MGNLCSSEAKEPVAADVAAKGAPVQGGAAAPAGGKPVAKAAAVPDDPIKVALAEAATELKKNKGIDFETLYTVSKLIGHGAFAKVSICEHKSTKVKYAAKVVQKNLDDPEKQRDGEQHACHMYCCLSRMPCAVFRGRSACVQRGQGPLPTTGVCMQAWSRRLPLCACFKTTRTQSG